MTHRAEKLARIKKTIDRTQRESDKAAGELRSIMQRIRTEFGCSTIKEAQSKLEKMLSKEKALSKTLNKQLRRFEAKHSAILKD